MKLDPVRGNTFLTVKEINETDPHHSDREIWRPLTFDRSKLLIDRLAHLDNLILKQASFSAIWGDRFNDHSPFCIAFSSNHEMIILVGFFLDNRQNSLDLKCLEFRGLEARFRLSV